MSAARKSKLAGKLRPSAVNTLIPHLQEQVQAAVESLPGVARRRVLASDGWFVNDKLFTLVTRQARIVVRLLDQAAQDELLAIEGAGQWKIKNRKPMKDWLLLPESMHDDASAIESWVARAWQVVRSAPAASGRAKRKTAAAGTRKKASKV
jgi:TfoX/Sxy family transcriptional regulator of competence genes